MTEKKRRLVLLLIFLMLSLGASVYDTVRNQISGNNPAAVQSAVSTKPIEPNTSAITALGNLAIKGRAPKTGYERAQFSDGWGDAPGCNVRNYILKRDLTDVVTRSETDCKVLKGTLHDPYTGKTVMFVDGPGTSDDVQIDHIVALSNAWQTGAQQLSPDDRFRFANDPLNLMAVDGSTNQKKGDADAATWLPPNKDYRCMYVARQIAVKQKYSLWVTQAEHDAMERVLEGCPGQLLPIEGS